MSGAIIGALMALSMVQQTDTVFPVGGATLLDVQTLAGSVVVDTWDRDEVRIRAEHSRRTYVEIDRRGSRISVEAEALRGPANVVDYHITVPATLRLKIEGFMASITVNGALNDVEAETLQGDVIVRGGRGRIKVSSMAGSVLVEGAEGYIEIESVAGSVRIVDSSGEMVGETMAGPMIFENVHASLVDVASVGGIVWYDGTFDPGGTYFFASHGGSVTLVVPEGTSAQFDLSTVSGSVRDNLQGEMRHSERAGRHSIEVGGGDAIVEVETFGGRISILRKGTEGEIPAGEHGMVFMPGMDLDLDLDLDLNLDLDLGGLEGLLSGLAVGISESLSHAFSDSWEEHRGEPESRRRRRSGGGS